MIEKYEFTPCELLCMAFICCRRNKIKKRIKNLNDAYERISHKFDWINLFKCQNDVNMIKLIMFDKEQNDVFALCTKSSTNKKHVSGYIYII
jgi:hypothetical protein